MPAATPAALDCWGALEDEALTGVVAAALGRPVTLAGFATVPVAYQPGSPATGALLRVSGTTGDGEPWSVFLKVLHHPRHWPRIGDVPAEIRQQFLDQFPWRGELVAWEPGFADRLPAGMRLPRLYRLAELGDDRVAVWMEDVRVLDGAWDRPRFARAAHALGGLAARRANPELLAACGLPVGWGLRSYNSSRVQLLGLPMLERDEVWAHPLLVPADAPDSFVAIDVSFQAPQAVGFDLGQLLVGLTHAGELPAAALPAIHRRLVPAFTAGLRDAGGRATAEEVAFGYVASLVVRAGFTSLPFERLGEPVTPALARDLPRAGRPDPGDRRPGPGPALAAPRWRRG
ncbi:MAG TPA: aminoglycoside phosphotransferase [Actinomycetota bacterium]